MDLRNFLRGPLEEGDPNRIGDLMRNFMIAGGLPVFPGVSFNPDGDDDDEDGKGSDVRDDILGPPRPNPLDERSYGNLLDLLRNPAASIPSRVAALHRLLADVRYAAQPPAAIISEASLRLLADIVTREWPPGGDLAASPAESDAVAIVRPQTHSPPPAGGGAGGSSRRRGGRAPPPLPVWRLPHHSLRRVASAIVAELCKWPKAAGILRRLGFFAALPPLLRDLAARYRYGQSYLSMYGKGQRTDQGQYILERLVTAAATAANVEPALRRLSAESLLEPLVRFYPRLDARQAKVVARRRLRPRPEDDSYPGRPPPADAGFMAESDASESDSGTGEEPEAGGALRRRRVGRRAVNADPGAEVPELECGLGDGGPLRAPRRRRRRPIASEAMSDGPDSRGPGEWDPFPTAFLQLVDQAWCELRTPQREAYLEGGILAALSAFPVATDVQMQVEGPLTHDMRMLYDRMALRSFGHVKAADGGLRERAGRLRLRGNEAFKAGLYDAALAAYTEAVALDWDEPTHRNNRCFALLKLGRLGEAVTEGTNSVGCEPRSPRCWSRLAAVFEALQQWQLAHLCYSQALALLRPRTDEELQARLRDVESKLQGAQPWRFETIPPRGDYAGESKWRCWISRLLPGAQMRALEASDLALPGMMGANPSGRTSVRSVSKNPHLAAAHRSEAYLASTTLRTLWDIACAIEEAPRVPQLRGVHFNTSWTDTCMRDPDTGLVYYNLSCMSASDGIQRSVVRLALGKPRFAALRNGFCSAMARPYMGQPYRPSTIFLAHRAVPYYEQLKAFFDRMGVHILCESQHEAAQSAASYSTDPMGYNHRDQYCDEYRPPVDTMTALGDPPQRRAPTVMTTTTTGAEDALSDDDTTMSYQAMLADTVATAGGDLGGGGGGGGAAEASVMPSDDQIRTATAALLKVVDPDCMSVRQLRASLSHKFGTDVACKIGIIRDMAARAGIRA